MNSMISGILNNIIALYRYKKFGGNVKNIFTDIPENFKAYDRKIIESILDSYYDQKEVQKIIPAIYQPGEAWGNDIKSRRANWLKLLEHKDIEGIAGLLSNLLRNNGSVGLQTLGYYSNITNGSLFTKIRYVSDILVYYDIWKNLTGAKATELDIPMVGNPWGYRIDNKIIQADSIRHHYFAFRVRNLLDVSTKNSICEIGGGYCGLTYFLMKEEKNIRYLNFDLPEILLIASYFLLSVFPEKKILLFNKNMYGKEISDLGKFDIILMPNFMLPFLPSSSVGISLNTNSLTEMDYERVKEYIYQITRITRRFFYHCNSDFPRKTFSGQAEIRASDFPIDNTKWKNVFVNFYPFFTLGRFGNYKEFLYEKLT